MLPGCAVALFGQLRHRALHVARWEIVDPGARGHVGIRGTQGGGALAHAECIEARDDPRRQALGALDRIRVRREPTSLGAPERGDVLAPENVVVERARRTQLAGVVDGERLGRPPRAAAGEGRGPRRDGGQEQGGACRHSEPPRPSAAQSVGASTRQRAAAMAAMASRAVCQPNAAAAGGRAMPVAK